MIFNDYYRGFCIRDICHAVKSTDENIKKEAVTLMADWYVNTREIGSDCVLVPVPQHTGRAEYTLEICKSVSEKCGCKISDVLYSVPHKSVYAQKASGNKRLYTGLYRKGNVQDGKRIYLIDNVISTGTTIRDCLTLIPDAVPFAYAKVQLH